MSKVDWQGEYLDLVERISRTPVSSGVCCCGNPMPCLDRTHSGVDMWDWYVAKLTDTAEALQKEAAQRPTWDEFFLGMAQYVATRSKDPSTQVGAVIVDGWNRFISMGYNGPPMGVPDDPDLPREVRLRRTVHAEKNAILFARRDLTGATLYATHAPCSSGGCAPAIVQSGIARVVAPKPVGGFAERWADDIAETALMFQAAGVILDWR